METKGNKYWKVSLFNFISSFTDYKPEYDMHPLATKNIRKIFFKYKGKEAFIEPVNNYKDVIKLLQTDGKSRITAVMIGEIKENSNLDKPEEWLPLDTDKILGMATGSRVSIASIEMFDETGIRFWLKNYQADDNVRMNNIEVIDEILDRGLGQLLTKALTFQDDDAKDIRVCISQLMVSRDALFIETKFSSLTEALDRLISKKKIFDNLGEDIKNKLLATIDAFGEEVKKLNVASLNEKEKEVLETLKLKVGELKNAKAGFATGLIDLLHANGLKDYEVMKDVRFRNNSRRWKAIVNYYRNLVTHQGSIDPDNIHFVYVLVKHLQDILIRLVFKKIGYEGTYQPRTILWQTKGVNIDWVAASTSPEQLGYGEFIE